MIFKWPYSAKKSYSLNWVIHCCWMELYKNISFNEKWHWFCADSFCVIIVLGFANKPQLLLIWQFVELLNFEWREIENVHYCGLQWGAAGQGGIRVSFWLCTCLEWSWCRFDHANNFLNRSKKAAVSRKIILGRWYEKCLYWLKLRQIALAYSTCYS